MSWFHLYICWHRLARHLRYAARREFVTRTRANTEVRREYQDDRASWTGSSDLRAIGNHTVFTCYCEGAARKSRPVQRPFFTRFRVPSHQRDDCLEVSGKVV